MKARWNITDTLLTLLLVAILAAGGWFLTSRNGGQAAVQDKTVEVLVELTRQTEAFSKLPQVGDAVNLGEKEKIPATVTRVEVFPARKQGEDLLSGNYTDAPIPGLYDVQITVSADGTESAATVEINGTAVRTGEEMAMKSKNWAGLGFVLSVDTKE